MMPRAKMVSRRMLPPANMSKKPKIPPWDREKISSQRRILMPGIGTCPPSRYTASRPSVNRTRLRRSGMRKTLAIASRNFIFGSLLLVRRRSADHFRRAAGRLNLLHRGLGEQMRRHVNRALQLARGEHLHAISQLPHSSQLHQSIGIERIALERVEPSQIDDGILLLENVGESALGQTAVQRHLAAFESAHDAVAGDRARALAPAAAGLAQPRAHAAAHALLRMPLSGVSF